MRDSLRSIRMSDLMALTIPYLCLSALPRGQYRSSAIAQLALRLSPPTSHFPTEPTQLAPSTTPLPPLLHGQPDVFSAVEASGFISKGRSPLCPPFKYLLLFCLLSAAGICTGDPLLRELRWKETTTSTTHRQGSRQHGQRI